MGWVGKRKPSDKSQTAGSTFKNIMLGSNLEIMSLELCFSRKGERELEIKYTLNRTFLTSLSKKILRAVSCSFFIMLLHRLVFAYEYVSGKNKYS